MLQLLKQFKTGVNSNYNQQNFTLLHLAVNFRQLEIARELLERGAKVDAVEQNNQITPLMLAAMSGDLTIVGLLLEFGADKLKRKG